MANRIRNERLEIKLTEEEKTLFDMLYIISLRYTDMKDIRCSVIKTEKIQGCMERKYHLLIIK